MEQVWLLLIVAMYRDAILKGCACMLRVCVHAEGVHACCGCACMLLVCMHAEGVHA